MKIIPGPFKDYYDHVAHAYGGGDPKVTYHRKRLGRVDTSFGSHHANDVCVTMRAWPPLYINVEQRSTVESYYPIGSWLVVCGKAYPLVQLGRYPSKYEIFDAEKHAEITRPAKPRLFEQDTTPNTPVGVELPQLVELSIKVGHPVFILSSHDVQFSTGDHSLRIDGNCPILRDVGLPALYPAEQLYQDLAYFLMNTMTTSPDMAPPEQMTDTQKVASHGFDKKISFRHRQ
jgi:hypothetical protein